MLDFSYEVFMNRSAECEPIQQLADITVHRRDRSLRP